MTGVGLTGYGYWGPNLARAFSDLDGARLRVVCDRDQERLGAAKQRYPLLRVTTTFDDLLTDPEIDAVVIATPVASHFDLALKALRAGRHVFVEKPMVADSEAAGRLIDEAAQRRLVLMVDHPFVYTSAVRKIAELIHKGDIGELNYYDSVRINLGRFQPDVNVLWDLAAHDFAILDVLVGRQPVRVSATGASHIPGEPQNIAYVTLFYDDSLLAHVHVNWLAPVKIRRTLIGGSRRMIVYDDLEPSEKVKVYDRGVALKLEDPQAVQMRIGYRAGDMWAPHLEVADALQTAAAHFVACIETGGRPLTDGQAGRRVVRILEAATASLLNQGQPAAVAEEACR